MRYPRLMPQTWALVGVMSLGACTMKIGITGNLTTNAGTSSSATLPAVPSIALSTPAASPSNNATPSFTVALTGGDSFRSTDSVEIFDGANCVGTSVGTATGSSGTSKTITVSALTEGSHTFSVQVSNSAGDNCSSSNATSSLRAVTYVYDATNPTWANSLLISLYRFNSLSRTPPMSFTANADDGAGSGILGYQYAIGTTSGANDIVDWTTLAGGSSPTSPNQVTGLSLTAGNTYYYSMRALDNAQNASSVYTQSFVASTSFYNNATTMTINQGAAYTNNYDVTLYFSQIQYAQDVYITQTANCASGGSWQSIQNQMPWTLLNGNQTNTIYAKFQTAAGENSDCISASIIHDDIAPSAPTFVSFDGANPGTSTNPKVIGIADSSTQKIKLFSSSSCSASIGEGLKSDFEGSGIGLFSSLIAGNQIDIYGKAIDAAGNFSSCTFLSNYQNNDATPSDTWYATSSGGGSAPPSGRTSHTLIWTGSEMIVWGGMDSTYQYTNTGSIYDPTTDTWHASSTSGAPAERGLHSAIWTGSEMIIWDGITTAGVSVTDGGGRYNPVTDTWTSMNLTDAPLNRFNHTAVWTGTQMIIWGGTDNSTGDYDTGGIYDPTTDSWTPTSQTNAPSARTQHSAVWTGSEMIVWGGYFDNVGARYNPKTDTWTTMAATPSARTAASMVWTGSKMILWGGNSSGTAQNSGYTYDTNTNSWTSISSSGAPSARSSQPTVWTGTEMVVWGGQDASSTPVNSGARYNPTTNTWTSMTTSNAPSARVAPAVWTGSEMIVWGGTNFINTGGRYSPSLNSWTNTSNAVPTSRQLHTAVWSGSEMLVWGGDDGGLYSNAGGRYDPVTDTWASMSTTSAPVGRYNMSAVWTGSKMIVWGGYNGSYLNTGGIYDPSTDSWSATSTASAPSGRGYHTAVWNSSGSQMIVWGGINSSGATNTGSIYTPSTNTWTATSTSSAPTGRIYHTAVWTGSKMIVWGGFSTTYQNTGGLYDPALDSWTATNTTGAPSVRQYHSAVWTGSRMIIWGGNYSSLPYLNNGGIYNPSTNSWTGSTSSTGAPLGRYSHTAVWTGTKMIVWGGRNSSYLNDGGVYDPTGDTWTATSLTNAPSARTAHTAVWTGSQMIIWGGTINTGLTNSGARYIP